jgi:class I fructose-bisphosphate aldolase
MVKLHPHGTKEDLEWAVKAAGRCHLVVAGGTHEKSSDFLKHAKEHVSAGITGLAVGRNIWQSKDPIETTNKIKKILWP